MAEGERCGGAKWLTGLDLTVSNQVQHEIGFIESEFRRAELKPVVSWTLILEIRCSKRGLKEADPSPRNVKFSVADITKVPGKPASYDAVLAMNMLHTLKDSDAGVNAMKEQLKSGGVMVTKTPALRGHLFYRVAIPVMRLAGKAPPKKFFSLAAITKLHTDAGLNIVETEDYGKGSRLLITAKKP